MAEFSWPDPIPFDNHSDLPQFPINALPSPVREMVEAVANVVQVDPAMPACLVLSMLSMSLAKKGTVHLKTHTESLNLYICISADSGERKSATIAELARPVYKYQSIRREVVKGAASKIATRHDIAQERIQKLKRKITWE